MDYEQWMHIIVLFFWITTILACILAVLRGSVFAISFFYPQLFIILIVSMGLVEEIISFTGKDDKLIYIPILLLIYFAINILIGIYTLRNQYMFWGIDEKAFLEAVHIFFQKNNLEYREVEKNKIILPNYPDDIYEYKPMRIIKAGTMLKITNIKKGKIDQGRLIPKIKDALSRYSMSLSSKILLIPIILLSCFMLYMYYLLMM